VRCILTSYKKIAGMARPIPFQVRISCRCPDRDCYLSAGNATILVFVIFDKFAPENNALKHQ
jgi:hypothetical protein